MICGALTSQVAAFRGGRTTLFLRMSLLFRSSGFRRVGVPRLGRADELGPLFFSQLRTRNWQNANANVRQM
jgi:hypothetical protein